MLIDHQQRQQATDPKRSYIVQAPAGSGKTEILTQRYLRLLATVNAPEQVIALTFTRKAANEMRERILLALQRAAQGVEATSPHQQQTQALAHAALQRDRTMNWQLMEHPGRLRVITIDSLCQTLTRAIPLQDKQIPFAQISEKPSLHYQAAAEACLSYALNHADFHPPLKVLLKHVDNQQDRLLSLLSDLLSNRDQWLHLLYQAKEQKQSTYEQALLWIEEHELARFHQSLPVEDAQELIHLVRELACIENNPESPRHALREIYDINSLDRNVVKSLACTLLTGQNTLRKSFDHHVGLKRGVCEDETYTTLKKASTALLQKLNELPDFLEALLRVKQLPEPQYHPEQWKVLQALFTLLPLLAAHLTLTFTEHNEIDFISMSEQALAALGHEETPTDLALYLDNQIHHVLVDEFQDTSIQQFHLLSRLVQGWGPTDGKTLFLVGDPMQSIYRFRSAEVGLFLRAQADGIGPVRLTSLQLTCNFRSTAAVVNWVNQHFRTIFPSTDDMESGAISFHPSINVQPNAPDSHVMAKQYTHRLEEAHAIVSLITEELDRHPTDEIALLVRSRQQLAAIMPLLREQHIPFQGVEIDPLTNLPHLRDVWSLTQALLMPANRLVWLNVLRSPWCGLSLADLLCIAQYDKKQSIYVALSHLDELTTLSQDGQMRARFIYKTLDHALKLRHQQPLVDWILKTLHALHLNQILSPSQQQDLTQLWLLLEQFERDGQLDHLDQLTDSFNKLYSQQTVPSRLKIMTIHKSKGLEFDCVILPGLSSKPQNTNTPMLRWLKLPSQEHDELWLLSPMKAADQEPCLLYDYLGKLDAQKNQYELQRLLYVAVTRARKRLYLFDHRDDTREGTFRHLLKHQPFASQEAEESTPMTELTPPLLHHLPLEFYQQDPMPPSPPTNPQLTIPHDTTPRLIGIAAHELLQWICTYHPTTQEDIPWKLAYHRLMTFGLHDKALNTAKNTLKQIITQLWMDPMGQWLIQSHQEEQNEYELLIHQNGICSTRIIDRTFLEQGNRWIIDFKTGLHEQHTEEQHRKQLHDYARLLATPTTQRIRCGLYYLASAHWITWDLSLEDVI